MILLHMGGNTESNDTFRKYRQV